MAIKVLIYEDNDNLRSSVQTLLLWNNEIEVVAAIDDALNILEDIKTFQPDAILMDIEMPKSNGVESVQKVRSQFIEIPIIMFTVFDDDENIFNAIQAGANGYLLKKNFEQIPSAIADVMNGGAPMTSSVAKKVLNFIPKNKKNINNELESLTPRETELLDYIVKGYSYKMIAAEMLITVETVRSHIKKIYKKLQVNSATGAVYKFTQGK